MERILFVLTEGCSWRGIDSPDASWNTVYQYHRHWCQTGLWQKIFEDYGKTTVGQEYYIDSTHIKVHAHGSNPQGGQIHQDMGRTKGGMNTKIHATVDRRGAVVSFQLSAGTVADVGVGPDLILGCRNVTVVADKGYDSDPFRTLIRDENSIPCIPSRSNRKQPQRYSKRSYRRRHKIENHFEKLKRFRRIATRYDKLSIHFLGFVCLASYIVEHL